MCKDDVTRRELFAQLLDSLQKCVVIRHENLDVIAQPSQFTQRTDKIWNRPRRSVPNEHRKTFAAQMCGDSATDNSKPYDANVCVLWIGSQRRGAPWARQFRMSLPTKVLRRNAEIIEALRFAEALEG